MKPMTMPPVSPAEIREFLRTRGWTNTALATTLGVTKTTAGRWINGETDIPAPIDKLLRMLIRGENPFLGDSPATDGQLEFTAFEWRLFEILRIREGSPSVQEWITRKIRLFCGLDPAAEKAAASLRAAEEPTSTANGHPLGTVTAKYPKPSPADLKVASTIRALPDLPGKKRRGAKP